MKHELKANINLTIECENTIEMNNIMNHLKQIIEHNLDKRLELVNTDSITVKPKSNKRRTIRVDQSARNFVGAIEKNTYPLWTPDYTQMINAIIISPVVITDQQQVISFDGIQLELAILKEKLGIEEDY